MNPQGTSPEPNESRWPQTRRKGNHKMENVSFKGHVKAIMAQENVNESKAKMMAWMEGPVEGQKRIDKLEG